MRTENVSIVAHLANEGSRGEMPHIRAMVSHSTTSGCEQGSTWLLGSGKKTRRLPAATHTADAPASSPLFRRDHVARTSTGVFGALGLYLPSEISYFLVKKPSTSPKNL